jgi:hypothetical protein
LLAIFDHSEDKVVIISDRLYRISFDEFSRIESKLRSIGLIVLNDKNTAGFPLSQKDAVVGPRLQPQVSSSKVEKEYIGSPGGKCVIVNGLEPKIQFMGLDDIKSIDSIMNTYGKMPDEISRLINGGQLIMLNESEKQERIEKMKQKMSIKGKSIKQATSKSVRMSENYSDDNSSSEDSSDVDVEDRVMRNAVKIDL